MHQPFSRFCIAQHQRFGKGYSLFRNDRMARTYFFTPWSDFLFGYHEGDLKFIYNATIGTTEIYDLRQDPLETTNLAAQMSEHIVSGHESLAAWVQSQNRFFIVVRADSPMNPTISDRPPPPIHQEVTDPRSEPDSGSSLKILVCAPTLALSLRFGLRTGVPRYRVRYKRSILGFAWSLINPLLQLSVVGFVFHEVLPSADCGGSFPLFLLTGLLAWNWFQTSLLAVTGFNCRQ